MGQMEPKLHQHFWPHVEVLASQKCVCKIIPVRAVPLFGNVKWDLWRTRPCPTLTNNNWSGCIMNNVGLLFLNWCAIRIIVVMHIIKKIIIQTLLWTFIMMLTGNMHPLCVPRWFGEQTYIARSHSNQLYTEYLIHVKNPAFCCGDDRSPSSYFALTEVHWQFDH